MILAAAAVAALTLAGGLALAMRGDDDDLPVLDLGAAPAGPMAAGGDERAAESDAMTDDVAAGASMALWARYEAADELPDLGGSAPVYRMVAGDDDLRAIAEHLGVQGEVTAGEGDQRQIVDGAATVSGYGATWWYTSGEPYPGEGDRGVSSGCVAPEAPDGAEPAQIDCPEPEPMPEPERPAGLPSQTEAEGIIRAVAEAAGLDLTGAQVTSYDNVTTWGVNIELALDGRVIPGWSVYGTVMDGGRVLDAGGAMGRLEELGDYPLDTTRAAIDRMNAQTEEQMAGAGEPVPGEPMPAGDDIARTEPGVAEPMPAEEAPQTDPASPPADGGGVSGSPGAGSSTDTGGSEPAPAPDEMTIMPVQPGEPIVVTLRSGELSYSLMGNADGTQTYLVPTYLLDGEDGDGQPWEDVYFPAVRADLLGG